MLILRNMSAKTLWRAIEATTAGYLPTWGIYFAVYEWSKRNLSLQGSTLHMASALNAGVWSTVLTNPLWMVRSNSC